jgi:hypothetical protein
MNQLRDLYEDLYNITVVSTQNVRTLILYQHT